MLCFCLFLKLKEQISNQCPQAGSLQGKSNEDGETVVLVLKSLFLSRHEGLIWMWKADASPGGPSCRGETAAGPGL